MLNLFEVPVTLLTPLFRLGFHSFDLNIKKTTNKKKLSSNRSMWCCYNVTCHKGPMSLSVKHLFACLVKWLKRSWCRVVLDSHHSHVLLLFCLTHFFISFVALFDLLFSLVCTSLSLYLNEQLLRLSLQLRFLELPLSFHYIIYPLLVLPIIRSAHVLILSHLVERDIVCRRCQSPKTEAS